MKPDIPTDNLYKFMAVGGIVVAIAAIYLAISIRTNMLELWHKHLIRYEHQLVDVEKLEQRAEEVSKDLSMLENLETDFKNGTPSESNSEAQKEYLQEIKSSFEQVIQDSTEIRKAAIEEDLDHKYLKSLDEQNKVLLIILYNVSFLGLVASIYGFWLWYSRLQVYVDEKTKNEALSNKNT